MVAIPTPKSLSDGQRSLISYDEMEKVIATLYTHESWKQVGRA